MIVRTITSVTTLSHLQTIHESLVSGDDSEQDAADQAVEMVQQHRKPRDGEQNGASSSSLMLRQHIFILVLFHQFLLYIFFLLYLKLLAGYCKGVQQNGRHTLEWPHDLYEVIHTELFADPSHLLWCEFIPQPSGRSYDRPPCRWFRRSFIPPAVSLVKSDPAGSNP